MRRLGDGYFRRRPCTDRTSGTTTNAHYMEVFRTIRFLAPLLLVLVQACGDKRTSSENEPTTASQPSFSLARDQFQFSERLGVDDTLVLYADLGTGPSRHSERNLFYRKDGLTWIESWNSGDFIPADQEHLSPVKYRPTVGDTLCFERLFQRLAAVQTNRPRSGMFTLVHNGDTVRYNSVHLIEVLHLVDYYMRIKGRYYPEAELYNTPIPPPR